MQPHKSAADQVQMMNQAGIAVSQVIQYNKIYITVVIHEYRLDKFCTEML